MKLRQTQQVNWIFMIAAFAVIAGISVGSTLAATGNFPSVGSSQVSAENSAAPSPDAAPAPQTQTTERPVNNPPTLPGDYKLPSVAGTTPKFNLLADYATAGPSLTQEEQRTYKAVIDLALSLAHGRNSIWIERNYPEMFSKNRGLIFALKDAKIDVQARVPLDVVEIQTPQGLETIVVIEQRGLEAKGWATKNFLCAVYFLNGEPKDITW